jgi:hypothetical protein
MNNINNMKEKKYAVYILTAAIMLVSILYTLNAVRVSYMNNQNNENHALTIITNSIYFTGSDLVAAVHLSDGNNNPVKGELYAELRFSDIDSDTEIIQGNFSTDRLGNSTIILPVKDIESGAYALHITAHSDIGSDEFAQGVYISDMNDRHVIIHFDKGMYKPGDTVLFRVLAVNRDTSQPVRQDVRINIYDGNNNRVYRENVKTSEFGIVSGRFTLADEVNSGIYRFAAEIGGIETQKTFEVSPYILPRFEVNISTDKNEYIIGETMYITGNARYFFDEPVNQGSVNVFIDNILIENISLGEDGEFALSHAVYEPRAYNIRVEAVDNSNFMVQSFKTVYGINDVFEIELLPEYRDLVYNLPNDVYIFTKKADGSPVKAYVQVTGAGFSRQVATDENGIGKFILEDVSNISDRNDITVQAVDMDGNTVRKEFSLNAVTLDMMLRTDKPKYNIGEPIQLSMISRTPGELYHIYVYKNTRLLQVITTEHDSIELDLGDIYGIIDIFATKDGSWIESRRTIFIVPGERMRLSIDFDKPEYKPG